MRLQQQQQQQSANKEGGLWKPIKRPRLDVQTTDGPVVQQWDAPDLDADFELLLEAGALGEDPPEPLPETLPPSPAPEPEAVEELEPASPVPSPEPVPTMGMVCQEEAARRSFASRLCASEYLNDEELSGFLTELALIAPSWGVARRYRSSALLLLHVARAGRPVRAALVAEGLPLLGELLQDTVQNLDSEEEKVSQEAGMRTLACLACFASLPLGRATMWEHRNSVGKAFDRLRRWCDQASTSAFATEIRSRTVALCKRWRRQVRPAFQDTNAQQKAVRIKVLDLVRQGLQGMSTPSAPVPSVNPGYLHPSLLAAEVEALLFGMHSGPTLDYKQHARMLRTNLALLGNGPLRLRLLTSEITAEELVGMSSLSLAPEEMQEQRRAEAQEAMRSIVVCNPKALAADSDEVREQIRDRTYSPSTVPRVVVPEIVTEDPPHDGLEDGKEPENPNDPVPAAQLTWLSVQVPSPEPFPVEAGPPRTPGGSEDATAFIDAKDGPREGGAVLSPVPEPSTAQFEDDEQIWELIRWFMQPVKT